MGKRITGCVALIGLMVVFITVISVLLAIPTMLLWNWLVPDITKGAVTTIGFWQALGLNILCSILFKGNTSFKDRNNG